MTSLLGSLSIKTNSMKIILTSGYDGERGVTEFSHIEESLLNLMAKHPEIIG